MIHHPRLNRDTPSSHWSKDIVSHCSEIVLFQPLYISGYQVSTQYTFPLDLVIGHDMSGTGHGRVAYKSKTSTVMVDIRDVKAQMHV